MKQVRFYWKSKLIKHEHLRLQSFIDATNMHVLKMLDYYDPNAIGPSGRASTVGGWIMKAAEYFGKGEKLTILGKYRKTLGSPAEKETRMVAAQQKLKRREIKGNIIKIPAPIKRFLKRLGLNLETVAELGFGDISKQILKVSHSEKAGLTEREQRVVNLRLNGQTNPQIGSVLKISREYVRQIQLSATAKIKARLKNKLAN